MGLADAIALLLALGVALTVALAVLLWLMAEQKERR